ncbi:MAG: hypothetical protein ABSG81_12675 [Acidimicrobiales bacterium]
MTAGLDGTSSAAARAAALCDLGRFEDAIAVLGPLAAAEPDAPMPWCLLARAQIGAGHNEDALVCATRAVALRPDDEWPHRLRSIALGRLDRHAEAVTEARQSVRLAPHLWQTHHRLAYAHLAGGWHGTEARQAAAEACALGPLEAVTHTAVGAVALAAGDRDSAEAAFRHALTIDPNSDVAHNELARLHLRRRSLANAGGLADAASGFASALRANPRAGASRRNLELVVQVFLARAAYFIFLDAFLVARLLGSSASAPARVAPIVALAVPGAFVARFVGRLPRDLRRYLRGAMTGPRARVAAAIEAVAVLALGAGAVSPEAVRPDLAVAAAIAAFVGRVALSVERRRGAGPRLGIPVLWLLAATLGLAAVLAMVGAALALVATPPQYWAGLGLGLFTVVAAGACTVTLRAIGARRRLSAPPVPGG